MNSLRSLFHSNLQAKQVGRPRSHYSVNNWACQLKSKIKNKIKNVGFLAKANAWGNLKSAQLTLVLRSTHSKQDKVGLLRFCLCAFLRSSRDGGLCAPGVTFPYGLLALLEASGAVSWAALWLEFMSSLEISGFAVKEPPLVETDENTGCCCETKTDLWAAAVVVGAGAAGATVAAGNNTWWAGIIEVGGNDVW